jgi:O-methyltransferase
MHPLDAHDDKGAELYLELLKRCLTRYSFGDSWTPVEAPPTGWRALAYKQIVHRTNRAIGYKRVSFDADARANGRDWPVEAETMIGLKRLENIRECVTDVVKGGVPGDLIETGVWRGGATIFMRAILAAYGDTERAVWVADSFEGLPKPSGQYEADQGDKHWTFSDLAVSEDEVRANFERYGLLDDQVRFLKGYFQDTLADAPIEQLAVARLDGDMYESTIVALDALYPKLAVGGYLIVDDYGAIAGCRQAVDDYRREHGIAEPLVEIDWTGVYWKRRSLS